MGGQSVSEEKQERRSGWQIKGKVGGVGVGGWGWGNLLKGMQKKLQCENKTKSNQNKIKSTWYLVEVKLKLFRIIP